jgi:putative DNA primase/helicase
MTPAERVAAWANEPEAPKMPAASSNGFDLSGFIQRHEQLRVRKEKLLPDGTVLYDLWACPFNPEHTKGSAGITRRPDGTLGFKCFHKTCGEKGWKELRALLEPEYQSRATAYGSQGLRQGPRATVNGVGEMNQKVAAGQTEDAGTLIVECIADIEAEPILWLWPGYIARRKLTVIAGDPGLGKSQITASIAAVVTTGGRWPVTREQCDPGDVLFLTAEDAAADTLRPRLEAAEAALAHVYVVNGVIRGYTADGSRQERMFSLAEDLRALEAKLAELANVAVVVIDPISAYLGKTDSHKNAEVRALLAPLGELAARHNVAIIAISHLNKAGTTRALMRVIDSVAFTAAARGAYLVSADPDDQARRLLLSIKNNLAKEPDGLAFRIEGATVTSRTGPIKTSRVMWEATPVTITADEAVQSDATSERCTAVNEAVEWLRETLANGPIPSADVFEQAKADRLSERTLKRAAKKLGVKSQKTGMGGPWSMSLPSKSAKSSEGCQTKNPGTLRQSWHPSGDPEVEIEP